jgi:hypothetical protein
MSEVHEVSTIHLKQICGMGNKNNNRHDNRKRREVGEAEEKN